MLFNFVAIVALASSTYAIKAPRAFPKSALDSSWRRQEDPQKSRTLDPKVIAKGFASDGNPNEGQAPSLTSENNFINFCLTQKGVPLTDGKQVIDGSCNQVPMGRIAANDKMPHSKFGEVVHFRGAERMPNDYLVFPANLDDSLVEDTKFTIKMKIENLKTGNFVNAQTNYFAAPQFTDDNGIIVGHSHFTVQALPNGFQHAEPLDPTVFAFFKGVNNPADGQGVVSVDVASNDRSKPDGLPAGQYRLCSINSAANHQPVLVARAQRGWNDDCVYFTVKPGNGGNGGNNNNNNNGKNNNNNNNNNGGNNNNNNKGADNNNKNGGNNGKDNNNNVGNNNGGNNGKDNNQKQGADNINKNGGNNGKDNNKNKGADNSNKNGGNTDNKNKGGDNNKNGGTNSKNNNNGQTQKGNGQKGNAENLQKFNGKLGAAASAVTKDGDKFRVNDQTFNDVQGAIEASCNDQRNKCADAANRTGGKDGVNIPACDDQRDKCMAGNTPQGLGKENLNKFKGLVGDSQPIRIASTQNGGCFTDGASLPNLKSCVQRACDAQRNRCADNRNDRRQDIKVCDQQRDVCLRQ